MCIYNHKAHLPKSFHKISCTFNWFVFVQFVAPHQDVYFSLTLFSSWKKANNKTQLTSPHKHFRRLALLLAFWLLFFLLRSCLNWVITNKQIDNLHTMWMIVIWNVIILLLLLPLYHPFCEISIQDLTHTKCETNRENGLHKWIFMLLLHILCYFQSLSVGLCVSISLFLMHLCASKSFEGTLYLSSSFFYFLRWRSAMHTHTPTPFPTWIRGMTVWLVVTFVSRVYYFHLMS